MSEILNEQGSPIQAEAPVAGPVEFSFSLQANAEGITELKFVQQVEPLFGTLLTALDYINQSFDQPYLNLGMFLRSLADTADQIEAAHAAAKQTEEVPAN